MYPELLPDPSRDYPYVRNQLREFLERKDLLARRYCIPHLTFLPRLPSQNISYFKNYSSSNYRSAIDIPEFYVGSILAVTSSNQHAADKETRFVGICIQRARVGLAANFTLRNAIDNTGVEVKYGLYDPTIVKIECLLLEKRLDPELLYLRDAPLEYSKIDPDMEAKPHPQNEPVPINDIQVTLRPRPWIQRWERKGFKGIRLDSINEHITDKMRKQIVARSTPWERFDLMKQYRKYIPEEEQREIFAEIYPELKRQKEQVKEQRSKRSFVKDRQAASKTP